VASLSDLVNSPSRHVIFDCRKLKITGIRVLVVIKNHMFY
jgi:hypothetical protein